MFCSLEVNLIMHCHDGTIYSDYAVSYMKFLCLNGLSMHWVFSHSLTFVFSSLDLEETQMVAVIWLYSSMVQLSCSMWRIMKLSTTCKLWEDLHLGCYVKWKKMVCFLCSSANVYLRELDIWETKQNYYRYIRGAPFLYTYTYIGQSGGKWKVSLSWLIEHMKILIRSMCVRLR